MEVDANKDFSKWRRRLWPFHRFELKKLVPLLLMKFLISLNYVLLTNLKEAVIVTEKGSGAEVIPILKGWVVLPVAFIVAILYSRLSTIFSKRKLFYSVLGGFLAAIFIYGFILYPNQAYFTPVKSSQWLIDTFGAKYSHWVAVYKYWIHSLLFVTAELWGSVVILLMFWGFANDITTVNEAKRSYNIYIAAGDVAAFCTGPIVCFVIKKLKLFPYIYTVQSLLAMSLVIGFMIMLIYWWVNKNVVAHLQIKRNDKQPKKKKEKVSLMQGFKLIGKSPYLLGIAVLVIGYGLCMSLVEISWKANVKKLFPHAADYQAFTSVLTSYVGFIAFIISMFFGTNIIRRLGWRFCAQITPIFVGITGALFFCILIFQNQTGALARFFGTTPLLLIVMFGAFQSVGSKIAKYSFFDPTKEMSYIPLTEEEKVRGKASIDVVGSRLGKSGASWIQIAFLDMFGTGSILSISNLLLPIIIVTTISWIYSVNKIGKEFSEKGETTPLQN